MIHCTINDTWPFHEVFECIQSTKGLTVQIAAEFSTHALKRTVGLLQRHHECKVLVCYPDIDSSLFSRSIAHLANRGSECVSMA